MSFKELGKTISQELAQVFARIDEPQIETFIAAIEKAQRIILNGEDASQS